MLLSELAARVDDELAYPADLETVVDRMGHVRIEAPNGGDSEPLAAILGPLETDTFESSAELLETVYGNVSDDHIGRKFYDDRGGNPPDSDEGPRNETEVSF